MFRKKLSDILSKLSIPKEEKDLAVSLYGNYTCKYHPFGECLNYYSLYALKNSNHSVYVFQDGIEKTVINMNPFSDATIISREWSSGLCQIHRFHPSAFTEALMFENIEDIKPNFNLYNIFRSDGSKVSNFDQLRNREEFIAISKETFSGLTINGYFSENNPIHMIVRWSKSSNKNIY